MKSFKDVFLSSILVIAFVSAGFSQKIAYSSDGRSIAALWTLDFSFSTDVTQILIYDAATAKIKTHAETFLPIQHMVYAPDGRSIIYADRLLLETILFDAKGEAKLGHGPISSAAGLIDLEDQALVHSDMIGIAMSADGKKLYKILSKFLNVYTYPELKPIASERKQLLPTDKDGFENSFIGISPDGSLIAEERFEGSRSSLFVTKTASKSSDKIFEFEPLDDSTFSRQSVTFSNDGSTLMLRTFNSLGTLSKLTLWDIKTKKNLEVFQNDVLDLYKPEKPNFYMIEETALSPNGRFYAVSFTAIPDDGGMHTFIVIKDLKMNKSVVIKTLPGELRRDFESLAFSQNSKQLATLSTELKRGSLQPKLEIWNVESGMSIK